MICAPGRGTAAGAATGLALTVLGAAAAQRKTARKALRRELAVAYEAGSSDLVRGLFVAKLNWTQVDLNWASRNLLWHWFVLTVF